MGVCYVSKSYSFVMPLSLLERITLLENFKIRNEAVKVKILWKHLAHGTRVLSRGKGVRV